MENELEKLVDDKHLCNKIIELSQSDNALYQIIGLLHSGANIEDVLDDLKEGRFEWDSKYYETLITKPVSKNEEIGEGVFQCRNKSCRSMLTKHNLRQTRSGDEGMTAFVICTVCKTRFKA